MKFLITGGAGFIGSAVVRYLVFNLGHQVLNLDKLTYAGNLTSMTDVSKSSLYYFEQTDICHCARVKKAFNEFQPDKVMHLAAESHVDRSIDCPADFIQTNLIGTYNMLEAARDYWKTLRGKKKDKFRFHHISTDEVYGDLQGKDASFSEETPYAPSSPYSASKAGADHLVRAWHRTYDFPIVLTNCSNNYGPRQFPEKLIPLVILNALCGKPLPLYGDGQQIRDWLYVEDHARALIKVIMNGRNGETYNVGGSNEKTNLEVVQSLCEVLDERVGKQPGGIESYKDLITFVTDRPGHDARYAVNAQKIQKELDWSPTETFNTGIRKTVDWYLENQSWCRSTMDDTYLYERLGVAV